MLSLYLNKLSLRRSHIFFHAPRPLLAKRQLSYSCGRCSGTMVFYMILSVFGVPSSSQNFGGTCSNSYILLVNSLPATIQRPMGRVRAPTKESNNIFVVLSTINKMIWLIYYIWQNLLTTTQNILLMDIPHFLWTLGTLLVGRCLNISYSQPTLLLNIGSSNSQKFRLSFHTTYVMLKTLKRRLSTFINYISSGR